MFRSRRRNLDRMPESLAPRSRLSHKMPSLFVHPDYEALSEIARIRKPLDKFFDDVMVMVDDDRVRTRRLDLLNGIFGSFTTIADFSEIVTEKK